MDKFISDEIVVIILYIVGGGFVAVILGVLLMSLVSSIFNRGSKTDLDLLRKTGKLLERMRQDIRLAEGADIYFQSLSMNILDMIEGARLRVCIQYNGTEGTEITGHVSDSDIGKWMTQANEKLQKENFVMVDKGHFLTRFSEGEYFLIFKLQDVGVVRYYLVSFSRRMLKSMDQHLEFLRSAYQIVLEARRRYLQGVRDRAELTVMREKRTQFWQVLSTINHDISGFSAPMLTGLLNIGYFLEEQTEEENAEFVVPIEARKMLHRNVMPRVSTTKELLTNIGTSMSVLTGEMEEVTMKILPIGSLFRNNLADWLRGQNETKTAVDISWEIGEHSIFTDRQAFVHVLWNVIQNAIKYTSKGRVKIWTEANEKYICVLVQDSGAGIKESDIEKIGNYGERGEVAPQTAPGQGIGLWGAYQYIKLVGGKIEFDTQAGVGTTFRVYFKRG